MNEKVSGFKAKFAYCEKRQWKLQYDILSFQLLRKFTDKPLFIDTCLIFSCQKVRKKIETVAWTPYFNTVFIYQILHVMFTLQIFTVYS